MSIDHGITHGRVFVGNAFAIPDAAYEKIISNLAYEIRRVSDTTRKDVRRIVSEGINSGSTIREIADRLTTYFYKDSIYRSELIARTETGVAYNQGTITSYSQSGMVAEVDVLDGKDDALCSGIGGTRRTLAWAEANPLGHPNCTRVFIPVVKTIGS